MCLRRGSSEYGTEPLGSILDGEFLELLRDGQILKTYPSLWSLSTFMVSVVLSAHSCFTSAIEIQNLAA
jgi:hypothetical protein